MVVLDVGLEVLGQIGDAFGEDRHLDLGRACVAGFRRIVLNERVLALDRDRHRDFLSNSGSWTRSVRSAVPGCRPAGSLRAGRRPALARLYMIEPPSRNVV